MIKLRNRGGFTLLEIILVIVILGMVAALVAPRLRPAAEDEVRRAARSVATAIRYLNDRAITTGNRYRMSIVFAEHGFKAVHILPDESEEAPSEDFLQKTVLPEKVVIEDVLTERLGKLTDGEATLNFGSGGLANFAAIHLKGADRSMTVFAYPASGKVNVVEGYLEQEP